MVISSAPYDNILTKQKLFLWFQSKYLDQIDASIPSIVHNLVAGPLLLFWLNIASDRIKSTFLKKKAFHLISFRWINGFTLMPRRYTIPGQNERFTTSPLFMKI